MDSAKRANGGRTCIKLNQPSYKESLKPAACVKPWFGLDLNFFCFRVSLVDCKYAKHLPQFLHVNFFSLFWGFFCLFVCFFYYSCKCWKFVSPPRNLGFCFCCNLFCLFCSLFCVFFQNNNYCVQFIILFLFFPISATCQPDCLNGGICVNNKCKCSPGYSGPNCNIGKNNISHWNHSQCKSIFLKEVVLVILSDPNKNDHGIVLLHWND